MFRLLTTIVCLLAAGSVFGQAHSASYTKDYQREAHDIFDDIIGMRTAAGHGNVPAMAEYLADHFRKGGFDEEDIHVVPHTVETGEKVASLVVRYRGNGLANRKPVLLLAHMDVVDAIRSDWVRDPYTLIEEDGFFFGRGTRDNKTGVAMLTATFLRLQRENFTPTRDFIIAFTGDEETTMETIRSLVTEHRTLIDAEYVLNTDAGGGYRDHDHDPVAFLLQAAEKTYVTYELTIRNPGGHSSRPRADNAIYELATVLKNIEAYRFPIRTNEISLGYFREMSTLVDGELGEAMAEFARDPGNTDAQAVLEAAPGEVGATRTTCVATMLSAGHAENALPQTATATVNCRVFPGVPATEVQAQLMRAAGNPALEISVVYEPMEGPMSQLQEAVTATVGNAANAFHGTVPLVPYMEAGATDSLHTRLAGMPSYGVMGLFMRQEDIFSHGLNERVPVDSFYLALEYWHQILTELGGDRAAR
jgi:acetylornithine deacetylase/succinyl-diaminopimelate desuccinylase-like protein